MNDQKSLLYKSTFVYGVVAVLLMASLFLFAKALGSFKQISYIGQAPSAPSQITVDGQGDAVGVPDTAEFSFSIVEESKTVAEAQSKATKKNNDIVAFLKESGIDEKDIKTSGYSVYPKYESRPVSATASRPALGLGAPDVGYYPPQPYKSVIVGYEVNQTIEVRTKDLEKSGDLLTGVGKLGASNISGLNFTVEDKDKLLAEARDEAIEKAQSKADALADSLGVNLVRVLSFSENGGGYPAPYYGALNKAVAYESVQDQSLNLPTGEHKVNSNVTITFEIR